MKIAFRVDASRTIGFGHLSRCINLAEELRSRGCEILFVTCDDDSKSYKALENRLFQTVLLPALETVEKSSDELPGRSTRSEVDDANETIQALEGFKPTWLVIDSYELGKTFETKLRPHTEKIAVIDDLPTREHECNLFIDQNYTDRTVESIGARLNRCDQILIGPRFALLDTKIREARKALSDKGAKNKRIFVFCGGADPKNLTQKVVDALRGDEFSSIVIDVVIGAQNKLFEVDTAATDLANFNFQPASDDYLNMLQRADLAIGAGGTSTWERMCLGVPSIVVSIASNQEPACNKLGAENLISYLGDEHQVSPEKIAEAVRGLVNSRTELESRSERARLLVDGRGSKRVAEAMCAASDSELRIRRANKSDCEDYFNWVNDPEVRAQSFNSEMITWAEHKIWFTEKMNSGSTEMYVLEANGLPVGQVRFEVSDHEAEISYSLDSIVRGRAWAALLIEMAMDQFQSRNALPIRAKVKHDNRRSIAVFEKLGFSKTAEGADRQIVEYLKSPKLVAGKL